MWFAASFGVVFFARDLQFEIFGWPVSFWFAAQGSVLVFIAIVVVFAWRANRRETEVLSYDPAVYRRSEWRLHRRFLAYVAGTVVFIALLAMGERWGLSRPWIAGIFLSTMLAMYAFIGVAGRTADANEYYVAGRRIPAIYNGMATAADWMSAASFISLAGGLYLQGFSGTASQPGGLAYVLGWTGGFCLVALLVAPYLRRLRLYTVPDYFAVRFGGRWPRMLAALAAVMCSFTYVVAQIYGVGLDHLAPNRRAFRDWHFVGPGRRAGVFVSGRHARCDLDAGDPVRDHHLGISYSRVLVVVQADRESLGALWPTVNS